MSSFNLVFRKDKLNSKGEAPIHIRSINKRKVNNYSTGVYIKSDHWDFDKGKVKTKHPNSARMNHLIQSKLNEFRDKAMEIEQKDVNYTRSQFKDMLRGKEVVEFFPFADKVIEAYLNEARIGTHRKNQSTINKLKDYVKGRKLSFEDINVDFLEKYEQYLRTDKKNGMNTVHKDFKFIRKVFNDAYRKDLISLDANPFFKLKMKTEKVSKTWLTEAELEELEKLDLSEEAFLSLTRDMFVFACYTGGLRVSDLLFLKQEEFDGERINLVIRKTREPLQIKVPSKGIEILRKYQDKESKLLFPILSNKVHELADPKKADSAKGTATSQLNAGLKDLTKLTGITKRITFHTSRHTWATRALRKGMPMHNVSKLMGHAAIKETQIYAKIVNEELDKAMEVFND